MMFSTPLHGPSFEYVSELHDSLIVSADLELDTGPTIKKAIFLNQENGPWALLNVLAHASSRSSFLDYLQTLNGYGIMSKNIGPHPFVI